MYVASPGLIPNLRFGQIILAFQKGGGRAVDGGQRGADIVRNRTQKIGAHTLFFALGLDCLLVFDLGGQRARQQRDCDHDQSGDQIDGDGKVKCKIRKRKGVVDCERADKSRYNAVKHCNGRCHSTLRIRFFDETSALSDADLHHKRTALVKLRFRHSACFDRDKPSLKKQGSVTDSTTYSNHRRY